MLIVTLHEITGAGPKQSSIAGAAADLLQRVVNLDEFRSRVASLQFSYISRIDHDDAPGDVIKTILEGREYKTDADGTIDLRVALSVFYRWPPFLHILNTTTMGMTPAGGPVIQTGYWFINQCIARGDVAALAGHFLHEWMHVAGYTHRTTAGDPQDVAYAVGTVAYEIGKKLAPPTDDDNAVQ